MIFPTDDTARYSASIRAKLWPIEGGWNAGPIDFVKRSDAELGTSQSLDIWNRERFVAQAQFAATPMNIGILLNFWRKNKATTFSLFDFEAGDLFETEGVGAAVGTGAQTFNLPAKATMGHSFFADGSPVAGTLSYGTGPEGRDQVIIGAGLLADGDAITATYFGRHYYSMEFVEPPQRSSLLTTATLALTMREAF